MAQKLIPAPDSIMQAVNEAFAEVDEGFVHDYDQPAMTTPAAAAAIHMAQTLVVGSTICLVC